MAETPEIERLLEDGLNLYGAGDLEGALDAWAQVLSLDPFNAQANSYVDYVRVNYDLLTGGEPAVEDNSATGFPIEEEPEYQIEISGGELPRAAAVVSLDPVDTGWDLEDAPTMAERRESDIDEAPTMAGRRDGMTFDDATREFHGVPSRPLQAPDSGATEFNAEEGTGGLSQATSIRKRELGFVQPTQPAPAEETQDDLLDSLPTPRPVPAPADQEADDELMDSLPTVGPVTRDPESGEIMLPKATLDLPGAPRMPARVDSSAVSQAEVMLAHAPTRELTPSDLRGASHEPLVTAPTRDLGLRPAGAAPRDPLHEDEDLPTRQSDVRAIRAAAESIGEGTRHDIVLPFDPIAAQAAQILADVEGSAPPNESNEDRTRRRITRLLELAGDWTDSGQLDKAVSAVDLALEEDPNSALAQKLITRNKDRIMSLFQAFIGDLDHMPQLARPLHELANAPISPRAAFLLSRIDGTLTVDELLDVSGMPRLEAFRYLCQLMLRGILR